ncbi:MAG: hypothetical protein BJ554DRAFT_5418 [Olpidium bornovanus]|uniref:Uncharacterized protein n=1 Tax=Olpidium bornovanus TaxID=278681 RepID=A0A8H8DKW6_9FUNG|nr:MAG: hypothetical protein BJ554DRAFT_5418 [Olpidium bornovanus]
MFFAMQAAHFSLLGSGPRLWQVPGVGTRRAFSRGCHARRERAPRRRPETSSRRFAHEGSESCRLQTRRSTGSAGCGRTPAEPSRPRSARRAGAFRTPPP